MDSLIKSSSLSMASSKFLTKPIGSKLLIEGIRFSKTSAILYITLISSIIMPLIPGRWIFNATRFPLCSVTLCTCAIDAEAKGVGLNQANRFSTVSFNSVSTTCFAKPSGIGGTLSNSFSNSNVSFKGTKSGRLLRICPNLMNVGPSSSQTKRIFSHLVYFVAFILDALGINRWRYMKRFFSSRYCTKSSNPYFTKTFKIWLYRDTDLYFFPMLEYRLILWFCFKFIYSCFQ